VRPLLLAALLAVTGPAVAGDRIMPSMEERQEVFGEIDTAVREGRKAQVADLLMEVVEDPERGAFHAESYARLGAVLSELDLPYAALIAHQRALATDPELVTGSAVAALKLGDQVGDLSLLQGVFAANVGLDVDAATRSRMAYLAAREAHHTGSYGLALGVLRMVKDDDPAFPEAKALQGVVLSRQGRPEKALESLLDAQKAGSAAGREQRFVDMIHLNIARTYYAAGNFPRSIEYFAKVDRSSRQWGESQFERAWAHYRLQDMNGVLSLLHDHASPFLEGWYFPEASLLRIHALYGMCKFPEATRQIDVFKDRYNHHVATLQQAADRGPEELFQQMAKQVEEGSSDLPAMLVWRFESEDRFADGLTAVRSAEDETARLRNVSQNPFSERASAWVSERRETIIAAEGDRIRARAQRMADDLNRMLADAELSKLDMLEMETRLYQMASIEGAMPDARRVVSRTGRVKDGWREWAWEGEYWIDEVGYYRITAPPDCPIGLAAGEGG